MDSVAENSPEISDKSKKMKKESDDILEMVYQQLLSETDEEGEPASAESSSAPSPAPAAPSPAPSPAPKPEPEQTVPKPAPQSTPEQKGPEPAAPQPSLRAAQIGWEKDQVWDKRKNIASFGDLFLLYLLAKQCGKPAPTITASIEDTINIQQLLMQIENEVISILKIINNNWDYISTLSVIVDVKNNQIKIEPKE